MSKTLNLKQFSVDDLLILRDRVNALLVSRVDRERRDLETRLKRLHRFKTANAAPTKSKPASKPARKKKPVKLKKKVAPKYRNPENSSETWTGRGLQPRWMRQAISTRGKTLEDFRISA